MAAIPWAYQTYKGPLLTDAQLDARGAQAWELVAVLPSKIGRMPVATGVVVGYIPGNAPVPQGQPQFVIPNATAVAVDYDENTYVYIFKKPT
jgi:hypothetical protein